MKQVSPLWWLLIRLNSCNRLVSHYHQLSAAPSRALYVTTPGVAPTFMFTHTTVYKVYKYLYLYQWSLPTFQDFQVGRTQFWILRWFGRKGLTFLWSDAYFESGQVGKVRDIMKLLSIHGAWDFHNWVFSHFANQMSLLFHKLDLPFHFLSFNTGAVLCQITK